MGRVKRSCAFEQAENEQIQIILCITRAFALHTYILLYPMVNGQRRSLSDSADVKADRGICCPQMPEYTFLHGTAYINL